MKKIILIALVLIVLVVAAGVVTSRLGYWPVAATAAPSALELQFSQATLQASLARQARGLTSPFQPTNDILLAGQKMFKDGCAGCYGEPGKPSKWGTQNFYPRVPQFNDQPPNLTAPQMFLAIKKGIRYSGMGGWGGLMSDEKIWQVATFLEHIKSVPSEPTATPTPVQ